MADDSSELVDTQETPPPVQDTPKKAIDVVPMEDPMVISETLPNLVSSVTSSLSSPPSAWMWPEQPRLFLDICLRLCWIVVVHASQWIFY